MSTSQYPIAFRTRRSILMMLLIIKLLFIVLAGRYVFMRCRTRVSIILGNLNFQNKVRQVLFHDRKGAFSSLGVIGAIVLLVGVFAPSINVTIVCVLLQGLLNCAYITREVKRINRSKSKTTSLRSSFEEIT